MGEEPHMGAGDAHAAPERGNGAVAKGVQTARRLAAYMPPEPGDFAPAFVNPDGAPPAGLLRDLDRRA